MATNPPSAQPRALPPHPPQPPPSPVPGSKAFRNLQIQIMKTTLAAMPEPVSGTDPYLRPKEFVQRCSQMIAYGEVQIARLGPRVDIKLLQTTLQAQFYRALIYWRTFRFTHLPPEIISNIFRLVVWSTTNSTDGVRQRLYLTWVCRAWRRSMTEDPTLWNAIWFQDPHPYDKSWAWFERAGSAPLDVRINEFEPKHPSDQEPPKLTAQQMSDMLDRLFTKLPQIRMLVIIVDNWPAALTVLQKLQTAGNKGVSINIERLEIHRCAMPYVWIGPGFDTQGHRDPAVLFGGSTHRLNFLCLSGIHIDFNDTPLCNLTTLDLRHIAMNASPTLLRFREILRTCSRLNKLTLDGCGPQPEEKWVDRPPVELRNLRIFTLGSFNLSYACFIISQICAPRLRDLTLMNMVGGDYIPLIAMLTREFMQVRILTLYNIELEMNPVGKRTFVRWLDTMPEIAYARLARMKPEVLYLFSENPRNYRRRVESGSTRSEAAAPPRHVLCPKFQCMEVQGLPTETIAEFCLLRKGIGVPMKKMYLNMPWAERLTPEDFKILQQESTVYLAPTGTNTAEEDILLSEGWVVQ